MHGCKLVLSHYVRERMRRNIERDNENCEKNKLPTSAESFVVHKATLVSNFSPIRSNERALNGYAERERNHVFFFPWVP